MILSQVISILVIFHKSPLKFGLSMKIVYFRDIWRAISQQQNERFEFRKKRQLPLIKPIAYMPKLENWPKYLAPPLSPSWPVHDPKFDFLSMKRIFGHVLDAFLHSQTRLRKRLHPSFYKKYKKEEQ